MSQAVKPSSSLVSKEPSSAEAKPALKAVVSQGKKVTSNSSLAAQQATASQAKKPSSSLVSDAAKEPTNTSSSSAEAKKPASDARKLSVMSLGKKAGGSPTFSLVPKLPQASTSSSSAATVSQAKPSSTKAATVSLSKKPVPTSSAVDEGSCARTSGLRKAKAPPTSSPPAALSSSGGADSESMVKAKGLIRKILSGKNLPTILNKKQCIESVQLSSVGTGEFSPFAFLSANSVIQTSSLIPVPVLVPEKVLSELETPTPPSSTGGTLPAASGYQPYSSPLLRFDSYRLNPAFRSGGGDDKSSLSSLTFSNKLNPHKLVCRYELTGVCSNPKCTAQHIRDASMSREELVRDLVSYAPTLAGCTEQEMVMVSEGQSLAVESVAGKIASFSSKLLEKYGERVSEEELYKLAIHETNTERLKTRTRREFVHFDDRPWMTGSAEEVVPVKPLPRDTSEPEGAEPGRVPRPTDTGPEVGDPLISLPIRADERR